MRRARTIGIAAAVLAVAAVGTAVAAHLRQDDEAFPDPSPAAVAASDAQREGRDREISFFEKRSAEDPYSAIDRSRLAALYVQRARETGDPEDYRRAEKAARGSLALRTVNNWETYLTLSAALVAQHRFAEARDAARVLVEAHPDEPAYRAVLGETQLELGEYEAARTTFGALEPYRGSLSVAPRLARWYEVSGNTPRARDLLYAIRDSVARLHGVPREQVAWFHLRVGDLELRNGELKRAEQAFRGGLAVNPGDHRLLAAMARLEAARHEWKRAARYGEDAIAAVLDPATLGVVSDAYASLGDSARARELVKVMEVSAFHEDEPLHRPWGLFFLDHGLHVDRVAAKAAEEVRGRRDVYGYDLLAWALHKQGKHAGAREAMRQALRMGTQDATLFFHAGMIERALGDRAAARKHLERALELNPHFHPTQPDQARRALESL